LPKDVDVYPDSYKEITNNRRTLEYLPPYSPDLNSIERKEAQEKNIRKKQKLSVEKLL